MPFLFKSWSQIFMRQRLCLFMKICEPIFSARRVQRRAKRDGRGLVGENGEPLLGVAVPASASWLPLRYISATQANPAMLLLRPSWILLCRMRNLLLCRQGLFLRCMRFLNSCLQFWFHQARRIHRKLRFP